MSKRAIDRHFSLRDWGLHHRPLPIDVLRVFLGVALFMKGVLFLADTSAVQSVLDAGGVTFTRAALGHYIALAHIGGGLMLALGLQTRAAAIVQIPILAGAVIMSFRAQGLTAMAEGFQLSALVLALLLVYAWYGSGRFSLDYWLVHAGSRARRVQHVWPG